MPRLHDPVVPAVVNAERLRVERRWDREPLVRCLRGVERERDDGGEQPRDQDPVPIVGDMASPFRRRSRSSFTS